MEDKEILAMLFAHWADRYKITTSPNERKEAIAKCASIGRELYRLVVPSEPKGPKRIYHAPDGQRINQRIPVNAHKNWFSEQRYAAGLTQRELGSILGISDSQVAYLEQGHRPMPERLIEPWAKTLGCSERDIVINAAKLRQHHKPKLLRKKGKTWLCVRREELGKTQQQIAKMLQIDQPRMSSYERKVSCIPSELIKLYAAELECLEQQIIDNCKGVAERHAA